MRLEVHPAATAELEESTRWYAKRSTNAALRFVDAVDAAVRKVKANPDRFAKIDGKHRACSLVGFPFQLIYRFDEDCLQVIAVAHAKRRPNYWRRRKNT